LLAISKLKLRPRLVSKPELVIKYSSTPTTDIAGSVLSPSYFTSAMEVAVKETEVSERVIEFIF
jgi:hypothetical protein